FAYGVLRRFLPEDKVESIQGLGLTVDQRGVVFDVAAADVDTFLAGQENATGENGYDDNSINATGKYMNKDGRRKIYSGLDSSGIGSNHRESNTGKKLIIFDVNGMLADIVFPRPKDESDKYSHGKAVFKRPYLDDFLTFCFDKFNVGIWSSRMKKNLDLVVDCLFGDLKKKLLFIWDASHCRNSGMRTLEDRYKCIIFKELRKKHTGIFPTSYKYTDMNDDYLGPTSALRAYLEGFAAADDGRRYAEQNLFGEGPIDEMTKIGNIIRVFSRVREHTVLVKG
ncbi:HAD-like domain protein, partial [Tanacetum coccineum]